MKGWISDVRFIKNILFSAALTFSLAACANEPQQIRDVHTGISAGVSKRYPVYSNLLVDVTGQAFIATKGAETRYGIYVSQIATGTGWAFFNSAYSFGVQLPYERGNSAVLGCSSIGCSTREEGSILLTPAQFAQASRNGMEIKLQGSGGGVVIQVPAAAFQEAYAQRPE